MQAHQYLAIGFRLLAIVVFIYALRQLAMAFAVAFTDSYAGIPASSGVFLVLGLIPLLVAILLWAFPVTIAKKVIPAESEVSVVPEKTFSILVALVLTVGLYTIFYAAVDLVYWVTYAHLLASSPESYDRASDAFQENKASMLATAFEFMVSLFIILRAKFIASFLYRVAQ